MLITISFHASIQYGADLEQEECEFDEEKYEMDFVLEEVRRFF